MHHRTMHVYVSHTYVPLTWAVDQLHFHTGARERCVTTGRRRWHQPCVAAHTCCARSCLPCAVVQSFFPQYTANAALQYDGSTYTGQLQASTSSTFVQARRPMRALVVLLRAGPVPRAPLASRMLRLACALQPYATPLCAWAPLAGSPRSASAIEAAPARFSAASTSSPGGACPVMTSAQKAQTRAMRDQTVLR